MIFLLCLLNLLARHNALRDEFVHPCAVVMRRVGCLDRTVLHAVQRVRIDTRRKIDVSECRSKADRSRDAVHGNGKCRDGRGQDAVAHRPRGQ